MSIEKAIEALTAAVEENTAVQKKILANQEKALAGIASKDEPAEETTRSSRRNRDADTDEDTSSRRSRRNRDADEEKGDDEGETRSSRRSRRDADDEPAEETRSSRRSRDKDEEEPKTERASRRGEGKAADKKADKPKKITIGDIKAAFADLLDTDDKKLEEDRRDFVESVLDELGVNKTSEIDEKDFEDVLAWVADKKAGKKVTF